MNLIIIFGPDLKMNVWIYIGIPIIRVIYQRFPSPFARTHFYWYGKFGRPSCLRVSLDSDLQAKSEWRSKWPIRRRWDSTGSEGLIKKIITIEADPTVIVDVRVEHLCKELDLRWFCRVLLRELEFQLKQTSIPCCSLRALDKSCPNKQVSFLWRRVDAFILLVAQFG